MEKTSVPESKLGSATSIHLPESSQTVSICPDEPDWQTHSSRRGGDLRFSCGLLTTYNTRIYGVENRKIESISLALEVLIQEAGVRDFIACDRDGSFQKLAKNQHSKEIEALQAVHQIQFRFSVPNAHFSTGIVERRM